VQQPHPPLLLGATAPPRWTGRCRLDSSSRTDLNRIGESIAIVRSGAVGAGRDPDELRFICRGVVKVRTGGERRPLIGSLEEVRADLGDLATKGVTESSSS
jgi:hypothetical protein